MATEAEIEKKYKKLIEGTEDDMEKLQLERDKNQEIAQLFRDAARRSQSDAMRHEAINKYPMAVLSEVEGDTPEEMEESAKTSHERIMALVEKNNEELKTALAAKEKELEEAKASGWKGNTAGGGGAATQTEEEEKFAFIDSAWKALREGTLTQQQRSRLIETRVGDRVADAMERLMQSS